MTTIATLLEDMPFLPVGAAEADPVRENDALQEAQILSARFDVVRGTAGVIFELRNALQLREANTGVLVVEGVARFEWSGQRRPPGYTAWTVTDSVVESTPREWRLSMGLWPGGIDSQCDLVAARAAFYVGEVPGLGDAPPDYTGPPEVARAGLATWDSPITVVAMTSTETA